MARDSGKKVEHVFVVLLFVLFALLFFGGRGWGKKERKMKKERKK